MNEQHLSTYRRMRWLNRIMRVMFHGYRFVLLVMEPGLGTVRSCHCMNFGPIDEVKKFVEEQIPQLGKNQ